ncbi:hypothetical protein BU26DRAFT_151209 [Trematosphaeria pertusa]|uniref:Uncharacterized protein n=1 Tax=Trematosphaeria pertusa TaxID=390896 RepID=A0A6A6IXL3_9PLEO|nr:uncharacterized protein BU26DRAFT_151209 [Trematosphaeria pertusa]KAF2255134.1 hypothetical protein BU26DRAFT_151209 [Trematosphaeria pertusa]
MTGIDGILLSAPIFHYSRLGRGNQGPTADTARGTVEPKLGPPHKKPMMTARSFSFHEYCLASPTGGRSRSRNCWGWQPPAIAVQTASSVRDCEPGVYAFNRGDLCFINNIPSFDAAPLNGGQVELFRKARWRSSAPGSTKGTNAV